MGVGPSAHNLPERIARLELLLSQLSIAQPHRTELRSAKDNLQRLEAAGQLDAAGAAWLRLIEAVLSRVHRGNGRRVLIRFSGAYGLSVTIKASGMYS